MRDESALFRAPPLPATRSSGPGRRNRHREHSGRLHHQPCRRLSRSRPAHGRRRHPLAQYRRQLRGNREIGRRQAEPAVASDGRDGNGTARRPLVPRATRAQRQGSDRHTMDAGVRAPQRRLVSASGHHLGQAQPDAGERDRSLHAGARISVPAQQIATVLFRPGRHQRALVRSPRSRQSPAGAPASGRTLLRPEWQHPRSPASDRCARTPQPARRLDHRDPALHKRPFRGVSRRARHALRSGRFAHRRYRSRSIHGQRTHGRRGNPAQTTVHRL